MSTMRSALVAIAGVVFALAAGCGGPTPSPNPSGSPIPTGSAVTSPGPSSASQAPTADGSPGDLLAPERQPAFPGLYFPVGFVAQGTDHFVLVQAPFDCPTLTDVLSAGQWTLADRARLTVPTPDPAQPTPGVPLPDLELPEWLLLRWADRYAVARVGGDENGCLAQIWRLGTNHYVAHGAIDAEGDALELQLQCAIGNGQAQLGAVFFGADGTFFVLQTTVPLELGSHPNSVETELVAGQSQEVTIERAFGVFFGGLEGDAPDIPGIQPYYPANPEIALWQGAVEITSIDPLVGEITLEDLRNEAGEPLTLTTEFRCDQRPGQLTRAAEELANATPSPVPSPSPAPGEITVQIAGGPHAGVHEVQSTDAICSLNALGPGWLISYSATDPVDGELQTWTANFPEAGGKADVYMIFGPDFEDWVNTDSAEADVDDQGNRVVFVITGRDDGNDFTIDFTCYDVGRF